MREVVSLRFNSLAKQELYITFQNKIKNKQTNKQPQPRHSLRGRTNRALKLQLLHTFIYFLYMFIIKFTCDQLWWRQLIQLLNVKIRLATLRPSVHCPKRNFQITIISTFTRSETFHYALAQHKFSSSFGSKSNRSRCQPCKGSGKKVFTFSSYTLPSLTAYRGQDLLHEVPFNNGRYYQNGHLCKEAN